MNIFGHNQLWRPSGLVLIGTVAGYVLLLS
ncbi:uncharacterized protein METZ01_LOCUS328440 [marine metagenome]|uniref:Uncharacterized protein n=1 Tax=marine metagenome TaxID=408172 RepID=A0A382PQS5_9ZZZZ